MYNWQWISLQWTSGAFVAHVHRNAALSAGATSAEWVLASQRTMLSHSTVECECRRAVQHCPVHWEALVRSSAGHLRPIQAIRILEPHQKKYTNRRTKIGHNCTQTRRVHFTCQFNSREWNSMNAARMSSCMASRKISKSLTNLLAFENHRTRPIKRGCVANTIYMQLLHIGATGSRYLVTISECKQKYDFSREC